MPKPGPDIDLVCINCGAHHRTSTVAVTCAHGVAHAYDLNPHPLMFKMFTESWIDSHVGPIDVCHVYSEADG